MFSYYVEVSIHKDEIKCGLYFEDSDFDLNMIKGRIAESIIQEFAHLSRKHILTVSIGLAQASACDMD